ncbi:hypothetical protein ACSVC9_00335 [Clostridium sp. LBM24168]
MKINIKRRVLVTILLTSILTIIFASLSVGNRNSYILRVLTQGGLCLTMLLSGINYFVYQKQKELAVFMWFVSAFALFVLVNTIIRR